MIRPFASTETEFKIEENSRPARHWAIRLWIILIACWLVVTGLVDFRSIRLLNVRISSFDITSGSRLFLYSFNFIVQIFDVLSILASVLLLTRKEVARRITVAFCWIELALAIFEKLIDGFYWLYFGHQMVLPSQYKYHYHTLARVMYVVYIIAILIFLTRSKVVAFFRRND